CSASAAGPVPDSEAICHLRPSQERAAPRRAPRTGIKSLGTRRSEKPRSFCGDHWDGARWTRTANDSDAGQRFENQQIWAADAALAFAGAPQRLQTWSGSSWTDWQGTPGCDALGGTAPTDFWCASTHVLYHFDGQSWTREPIAQSIQGLLAKARNDVWIWGSTGASHFDGTRWTVE